MSALRCEGLEAHRQTQQMILSCHDSVIYCCLDGSLPRSSAGMRGSNNSPSKRNNNIGFRVVLAPAQPARQRAHWLTRPPSRPAQQTARRQTETEGRPVRVWKRSLPKAPGGFWACEVPSRPPGHV